MKGAAEGAGSNLSDDISKIKSESDHIVEGEVARSTESLKSVSGHAIVSSTESVVTVDLSCSGHSWDDRW